MHQGSYELRDGCLVNKYELQTTVIEKKSDNEEFIWYRSVCVNCNASHPFYTTVTKDVFATLVPRGEFVDIKVRARRPDFCSDGQWTSTLRVTALTRDETPGRKQAKAVFDGVDVLEVTLTDLDFWQTYYITASVICKRTWHHLAISVPFYTGPGGLFCPIQIAINHFAINSFEPLRQYRTHKKIYITTTACSM